MPKPISERRTIKEILELPDVYTPEIAKNNFRRLIKQYHPDVNKTPEAAEYSRKLIKAYNILTGKEKPTQQPIQRPVYRPFSQESIFYWANETSTNYSDWSDIFDTFGFGK
jgi:molecular chaperone DnaJ